MAAPATAAKASADPEPPVKKEAPNAVARSPIEAEVGTVLTASTFANLR